MKKKTYCSVVLGLLLCTSANAVFAEEGLKIPEFNENELEIVKSENTNPLASVKSFSKQQAPIYLSKEEVKEIKELQEKYFKNMQEPSVDKFIKRPILKDGIYELGQYNSEALMSVENKLNFYRELAGVMPIEMTDKDNEFAQYGAIGLAATQEFTHSLSEKTKPADMPEFFWKKACESAKASNIHSHLSTRESEKTFNYELDSYITDSGDNNKKVGHRSWVLGLQGSSFGMGQAKSNEKDGKYNQWYSTLYVESDFNSINEKYKKDFVMKWPVSEHFPIQLYNRDNITKEKNMRWSVSFNEKGYSFSDNVSVELLNKRTGEVINIVNDDNGGELLAYEAKPGFKAVGGYNTVVFRPNDDFQIESNTEYTVTVKGVLKDGELSDYTYTTRMVDMDAEYIDQDEAEKELVAYKETSKASLSEYKNKSDYRESEQEAITRILEATNTKIDRAKDKASIDELVKEAKSSLDKVKTDKELTAEETATAAKELAAYKETLKANLAEYKNKSDYRELEQQAITKILEATNTKIDGAKDKASVDTLVKEAKSALDKVKTDKELTAEETATAAKELAAYKETSKTSLLEYKNKSDYRESEQEAITKILEATNTKIDGAKDKASINELVKEAKSALDKVKTDKELTAEEAATAEKELADYKKTSKASLSEYKNKSDYRETEQKVITKILEATNTKIDGAKDKASVDTLVKEAKTSLDKVKTDKELTAEEAATAEKELAAYKETSKTSLSEYKNKSDYRESEQQAITKILEATNTKIDGAKDKVSIDTLVKEAKSSLDKVKTDKELTAEEANEAKDLAEYKKMSKVDLAKYKNKADYRKKQQEQMTIILNTTNTKIDVATTKATIDALVKEAEISLDNLKTDKELTAEEMTQSSVTYTDAKGVHVLPIDKNAKVKLSVSSKTVTIRVDKEKYKLQDLKEMTLRGFTIDNTVSFNLNGIETVTLDNVKFEKTLNISGTKDLETLVIKNSTLDKVKIHSASKLTNLTIDNTVFNDDLRIYSNRSLETAVISNSILKDELKQYSNHKNYKAQMINNEFKR